MKEDSVETRLFDGLKLLQQISKQTNESKDLKQILNNIVSGAIKLTKADTGVIYLIDKECTKVTLKFTPDKDKHSKPRLTKKNGLTKSVFRTKELIYIKDCSEDIRVNPSLIPKYKSMVAVPLNLHNQVIGVLFLNSLYENGFSKIMQEFLLTLATQSAALIQVKKSEAQYSSMMNNLTQSIFNKDRNSKFTFANETFLMGVKNRIEDFPGETYLDKLIDRTDFDIYPNELAYDYILDDKKVLRGKTITKTERHVIDGKNIWVKVVKNPIRDITSKNKKIIGIEAIFWNVNKEKIDQERYTDLFDQSPDGIVIHKNGRITHANKACLELFGVVDIKKQLIGKNIISFIHESDKELAKSRLKQMLKDKNAEIPNEQMKIQKQDNDEAFSIVEVHARPSQTQDKEIQVVFHEITNEKFLLQEMDHRVRNSLQKVSSILSKQIQFSKSTDVSTILNETQLRIQSIADIHSQLSLNLNNINYKLNLKYHLEQLIEKIYNTFDLKASNIECDLDIDENIELVYTKIVHCRLILNELITNSIKHAFKDNFTGKIYIGIGEDSENVIDFTYSDNGVGTKINKSIMDNSTGLFIIKYSITKYLKGDFMFPPHDGFSIYITFNS